MYFNSCLVFSHKIDTKGLIFPTTTKIFDSDLQLIKTNFSLKIT